MNELTLEGKSSTDKLLMGVVIADTAFLGLLAWQFYANKNTVEKRLEKLEKENKIHKKTIAELRNQTQSHNQKSAGIKMKLQDQDQKLRELEEALEKIDGLGETVNELSEKLDDVEVRLDGDEDVHIVKKKNKKKLSIPAVTKKPVAKPTAKPTKSVKAPKKEVKSIKPKPDPVTSEEGDDDIYGDFDDDEE